MTAAMQNKVLTQNLKDVRHKLFVMSGKGGVGKSSVTVNLATALASRGFTVGILDVDIHGPSVPRLLGASASVMADENGKMLPVPCGERMSLISMDSFLKDKDTAILWRGPKKTGAIRQFLTDVQWGALDYLVIDSPPGTGDEHLTVLDAIPDAGCIVVTTPQEISLADRLRRRDGLGVLLRFGEVDGDVQFPIGGGRLPLHILGDAIAPDVVRILTEAIKPVRGAFFRFPAHEVARTPPPPRPPH